MSETRPNLNVNQHWLVAAWPGMGNVAVIAAGYIIQKLKLQQIGELPRRERFDVGAVEVKKGVIAKPRMPRNLIYQGGGTPDLPKMTVFIGEAQPSTGGYAFAQELLNKAAELGCTRIVTFASMASQLHPMAQPRVYGATTQEDLLDELSRLEVKIVEEGQIGGLNGVLLGAAAERGVPGSCLMGEIPFFAPGMPNPKAARAVVDAFALMAGLNIEVDELSKHAEAIDQTLLQMMEKMQEQGQLGSNAPDAPEPGEEFGASNEPATPRKPDIDDVARGRLEQMFAAAIADRSKSMALKQELDRLGVFKEYENRFLDLFKRAE